MNKPLLETISFAKKAGKLTTGFDAVVIAAGKGGVKLVLTACDLSAKTQKELAFKLAPFRVPLVKTPLLMDEVHLKMGKRTGIFAISDDGFAKKLMELIEPNTTPYTK